MKETTASSNRASIGGHCIEEEGPDMLKGIIFIGVIFIIEVWRCLPYVTSKLLYKKCFCKVEHKVSKEIF